MLCPSKTQTSLRICAVCLVFDGCSMGNQHFFRSKTKTLIRLCECSGWFESLLHTLTNCTLCRIPAQCFYDFSCYSGTQHGSSDSRLWSLSLQAGKSLYCSNSSLIYFLTLGWDFIWGRTDQFWSEEQD